MNVTLIIHNVPSVHSGEARPFINWAKAEARLRLVVSACDFKVGLDNCVYVDDFESLATICKGSDLIITDDWHVRLGERVARASGSRLGIYAQIPYGLHALGVVAPNYVSTKRRIVFRASRYIPFHILSSGYRNAMRKAQKIVSNSIATRILLKYVYGIESTGVVYPPVDLSTFRPSGTKKKQVALFLGSAQGDSDSELTAIACKEALSRGLDVHTYGNPKTLPSVLANRTKYNAFRTDSELASLYSESLVTLAPQNLELFGYVPVEALACGTPALVGYFHEAMVNGIPALRMMERRNMSRTFDSLMSQFSDEDGRDKCVSVAKRYSSEVSVSELFALLEE